MAKKQKLKYCVLYIDNRGQRLLACSCGAADVAVPQLRICPDCRQVPEVQLVECAGPYHNDPKGCGQLWSNLEELGTSEKLLFQTKMTMLSMDKPR